MNNTRKLILKGFFKYILISIFIFAFGYFWFYLFIPYRGGDFNVIDWVILIFLIVYFFYHNREYKNFLKQDFNRICSWCNSFDIEFIHGEDGLKKWKYENKDGSKDKRRKNNYITYYYHSSYKCNNCTAETLFSEIKSNHPNHVSKVILRKLGSKSGDGVQTGSDWDERN